MITGERKQEYLDFANRLLGTSLELSDVKMISQIDERTDEILAACLFCNCSRYNMEICVAVNEKAPVSRRMIKECLKFAFIDCGVLRLTSYVAESNKKSIAFHERLGAEREFEGVLKSWFGAVDGIQMVIFKDKCKWIKGLL